MTNIKYLQKVYYTLLENISTFSIVERAIRCQANRAANGSYPSGMEPEENQQLPARSEICSGMTKCWDFFLLFTASRTLGVFLRETFQGFHDRMREGAYKIP